MKTIKDTGCCSFPTKEPEFKLQVKEGNSELGKAIQYSVIKWQTGEPTESDFYLVSTKSGYILIDHYTAHIHDWTLGNVEKSEITAWCKLSDIEPYKEEEV